MQRRDFLGLAGARELSFLPRPVWAARADGPPRRLVVVMLRGAVDGLNVVVPYGEAAYYEARPTIAIQKPGSDGGALALDGHFGLHPALARATQSLWARQKNGSPSSAASSRPTRAVCRFDAQLGARTALPDTAPRRTDG